MSVIEATGYLIRIRTKLGSLKSLTTHSWLPGYGPQTSCHEETEAQEDGEEELKKTFEN